MINQNKIENLNGSIANDSWLTTIVAKQTYTLKLSENQTSQSSIPKSAFVFCKIPTHNIADLVALQDCGFQVIETAIQFKLDIDDMPETPFLANDLVKIGFASASDKLAVEEVAQNAFSYTRFHLDPKLENHIANQIKKEWAGNYFRGERGDGMIVAREGNTVLGFLQYLIKDTNLIIDLIAVEPSAARRGIGRAMINFLAKEKHRGQKCDTVFVGTQSCNIASCNLYESMGFRIHSSHFSLHLHT